METLERSTTNDSSIEVIRDWFESFISDLTVDKLMMETQTAPKATSDFYRSLIFDKPEMHSQLRNASSMYFIEHILTDYMKELKSFDIKPQELAFDYSDAKILVWAQVADDDDKAEDAFILSEARANSKFSEHGFYISSTIVEQGDNLKVPSHYLRVDLR
jgi:hypothetical protein